MGSIQKVTIWLFVLFSFCKDTTNAFGFDIPSSVYISVAENTAINTQLLNFTMSGGTNVTVVGSDEQTRGLVRIQQQGSRYLVLVNGPLDREIASKYTLKFNATDSVGNGGSRTLTMFLTDVNDNSPKFEHIPYFWELNEDPGDNITTCNQNCSTFDITATDPDDSKNGTVSYLMKPVTQSEDRKREYNETFHIDESTGVVTKVRSVNYEHNSYYQFVIYACDHGSPPRCSNTSLIIQIKDVQDKPPFYTGIPYRITVNENIPKGSEVITVYAQDGDPGISNKVNYTLQNGPCKDLFTIGIDTGKITTNQLLDRDSGAIKDVSGVCTLVVLVQEIPGTNPQYGTTTTTTNVTVMVEDVDDNVPTFNAAVYNASVQENAPLNIPITINSGSIVAYDNDTGHNAQFELSIKYPNGSTCSDFEPWPRQVEGEQTVMVRVKNPAILDYEARHTIDLHIIATEVANSSCVRTSTISLTLIDVNDNNPTFHRNSYNLQLEENSPNFTSIGNITATDRDSDKSLTYSLSGGGEIFSVDNTTGEIRTLCTHCSSTFDRERRDVFYMTYVVTDPGGRSDSVPLEVQLLDVNDNAPMFDSNHSTSIRENDNTFISTPIVQFRAKDIDLDGTNNSLISYSILNISQPALVGNFSLNNITGDLLITEAIDYEALDGSPVTITVMASDHGIPQRSSIANAVIEIQDVNDNVPEFSQESFFGTISEDQSSNTTYHAPVGNITATDKDGTKPNNQFNYFITSGADEKFSIDSTGGEVAVQLNARLDREATPNYTLIIMIIDRGASPKSATAMMTISVSDVNDEDPIFVSKEFVGHVMENSTKGLSVVQCNATDPDLNPSLNYSIINITAFDENGRLVDEDKVKDYFMLNETNGMVSVKGSLDRETAKTVILDLIVRDENASNVTAPQSDTAKVRITILDVNDNDPVFVNANPTLNVSENSQTPAILTTITATDKDENRTINYTITRVYKTDVSVNPFSIDDGGVLSKIHAIDREVDDIITVTIEATDSGVPPLSAKTNVSIHVVDFNDNAPEFNISSYPNPCSVLENTTMDTIIFTIDATDEDEGPNANITFSIDSGDHGNFTIDPHNGSVRIRNSLDRESIDQYVLYITAQDNPQVLSEQKSSSTTVTILVTDVNDNPPVFDEDEYNVAKREDINVNQTVLAVFATDNDLVNTLNSRITYKIDTDNSSEPLFRIDGQTGEILVDMSLKDKVNTYKLNVIAFDDGVPRLNGSTTVFIEVDDVNLHAPVITNLPINDTIKIFECIRPNTTIHTFSFTDQDRGRNAEAYFNISTVDAITSQLITETFTISEDGVLRTRMSLDVNVHSRYTFQVQAIDRGDPVLKSNKVTIKVDVIDVNDHLPYFKQASLSYTVTENQNNIAIGTVTAYDKDKDAIKCYNITDKGSDNLFHLGFQNGSLTNTRILDYETQKSYDFAVTVHDCSVEQNVSNVCIDVTKSYIVNDTLTIHIDVRDENDNAPRFIKRQMFTGMIRRTEVGTPLKVNLKSYNYVMDNDSVVNGIDSWSFYNDGPIIASPGLDIDVESGNELCEDGIKHVFCISKNGTIMNEKYFKEDVSGYFIVPVRVNDTKGFDTANITVYLIGDSQILVMTLLDSKQKVAQSRKDLLESFSRVIGYTLVYDKLEDHKSASGQVFSDQADLHFHVVDSNTNDVLSGSDARRLLDTFSSKLTSTMKEFHVSTVDQSVQTITTEDNSSKTMFILAAVVVVLVMSNAIFIYVFVTVRNRYKRKLLAATINTNQDKGIEMQTSSLAIPGSNKYMAQSNPLLNADLDEKPHAEYDEMSLNSTNSLDANDVGESRSVDQSVYDRIEEKEVTLDMYTEDMFTAPLEGESPLDAAIRLHEQARDSRNMSEEEGEELEEYPVDCVNYAFDEQLESSEI